MSIYFKKANGQKNMQQTVNKCFGKYSSSAGQKRGAVSLKKGEKTLLDVMR